MQRFADTPATEAGILDFANEFGCLSTSNDVATIETVNEHEKKRESFENWVSEIARLRAALELFEKIRRNDGSALADSIIRTREGQLLIFEFRAGNAETRRQDLNQTPLRLQSRDPASWPHADQGDDNPNLLVGRGFLQATINRELKLHCRPEVRFDPERTSPVLRIMPTDLLGSIWWLFARMYLGLADYRRCKVCGRAIEISKQNRSRVTREFCTATCRQTHFRSLVKSAKEMAAQGNSIAAIARHFDVASEKVKRWLARK